MNDFVVQNNPIPAQQPHGEIRGGENRQQSTEGRRAQVDTQQLNLMGNQIESTQREDQFSRAALTIIKGPSNGVNHEELMRDAYSHVLGLASDSQAAQNLDIASASSDSTLNFIMHQDKFYRDEVNSRVTYLIENFPEETQHLVALKAKLNDNELSSDEKKAIFTDLKGIVDAIFEDSKLPQVSESIQELRDNIKSNNFFKKFGNDQVAIPRGRMDVSNLPTELQQTIQNQRSGGIGYNENNPEYQPHDNRMGKQVNTVDPELVTKAIFDELGIPFVGGASGSTIDFVGILADQLLKSHPVTIENGKLCFDNVTNGEELKKELEIKVFTFMMGMVECGHHSLSEMVYAAKQFGLFEDLGDPISSYMIIQDAALVAYNNKLAGVPQADELLDDILSNVVNHEDFITGLQAYAAKHLDLEIEMTPAQQVEATHSRAQQY